VPKLTLSVDENVVHSAKRYAAAHRTSVSQFVERNLDLLFRPMAPDEYPPVLRLLRGAGCRVSAPTYRQHIVRKYR
jgi:uncharacterized protein DUF6364